MSFLSILLVASAFYFAHARPESQSWSEAYGGQAYIDDGDVHDAPAVPAQSSVPIIDLQDYRHQLYSFMQDVSKAVDQHMTPMMTNLDVTKQDELKSKGMNRLASYVDYLLLQVIQEEENEKNESYDQTHGYSQDEAYAE